LLQLCRCGSLKKEIIFPALLLFDSNILLFFGVTVCTTFVFTTKSRQ
jgi:hypothetical protein